MKRLININDEVLAKYLLNEATEAERAAVQQWLQQADNKSYFDSLKLVWKHSSTAVAGAVNVNDAWARFNARTQQPAKTISLQPARWMKVAAILLLAAGSIWLCRQMLQTNDAPVALQQTSDSSLTDSVQNIMNNPVASATLDNIPAKAAPTVAEEKIIRKAVAINTPKRPAKKLQQGMPVPGGTTQKFICNGTPCPMEISITQILTCRSEESSKTTVTRATLEPDQSGQVEYKAFKKVPKDCSARVEEITIKRITTGETIVLNSESKPATATEVFNYLSGQKTGDILAGVFHSDCDNNTATQDLKLNNSYGGLILQ